MLNRTDFSIIEVQSPSATLEPKGLGMSKIHVYVLIEHREGELLKPSLETLGEALDLAELAESTPPEVIALLIGVRGQGSEVREQPETKVGEALVEELVKYSPHRILVAKNEQFEHFEAGNWANGLLKVLAEDKEENSKLIMLGATPNGKELAPRLAAMLGAGLVTDSVRVRLANEAGTKSEIAVTTPIYGDRVYSYQHIISAKAVVSFRVGARGLDKPFERDYATREIKEMDVDLPPSQGVQHLNYIPADPRTVHLTEAEAVVCGGAGVGKENFGLMWDLADQIGAAVGGTRVAVDKGWLEWDRQIGQTGQMVAPRLFVSCGTSGASQHITGMKDSRTVIVINADRNAPMFSLADIGIVGDVHEIVPKLLEKLNAKKHKE
jgi:electron transfer flavoprotein alpha subunit